MQVPSQLVPPCQGWSWPWKDNGNTPGSWMDDKGFAPPWRHCFPDSDCVSGSCCDVLVCSCILLGPEVCPRRISWPLGLTAFLQCHFSIPSFGLFSPLGTCPYALPKGEMVKKSCNILDPLRFCCPVLEVFVQQGLFHGVFL